MKHLLLFCVMLLFVQMAAATTIHGTVYDIDLEIVSNAVIIIEGVQKQVVVAKNGVYSVNVAPGNYTITVQKGNETILEEDISIAAEGNFVVDLVALRLLEDVDDTLSDELENVSAIVEEEQPRNYWLMFLLLLAIIITTYTFFKHATLLEEKQQNQKVEAEVKGQEKVKDTIDTELSEDLQPILRFIKQESRTTQKEIYRKFPYSEAKVSLMLAELEAKGIIQKIKKGRGNIIILK